jgi:hypothetical protein
VAFRKGIKKAKNLLVAHDGSNIMETEYKCYNNISTESDLPTKINSYSPSEAVFYLGDALICS